MFEGAMTKMKDIRRLIFHHADYDFESWPIITNDDPIEKIREGVSSVVKEIDEWHLKKWRSGLGYHFIIGNGHGIPDGYPAIGRPMKYQGAHVREHNHDSVGILIVGDLTKHDPTEKQIVAAVNLAAMLCLVRGLDPQGDYSRMHMAHMQKGKIISGHHDWHPHESNDCPGSLEKYLGRIRSEAASLLFSRMMVSPYTP